MAEFADVIKQAARMCKAYGGECRKCPADDSKHHVCMIWPEAIEYRYSTPEQAEQIVMDWAAKHPEPRYPSWAEWQKANFPNAPHSICPNYFMREKPLGTCAASCAKCTGTPIPADIAEKLGVKPIGGKNDA